MLDALSQRAGPDDDRTAGQRRADALDTMCTARLQSGHLPVPDGTTPRRGRVIVTIPYNALLGLPGAPGATLAGGTPIPAETARRLSCDAAIRRVVLSPPGRCPCGHTGPLAVAGSATVASTTAANAPAGSATDLPESGLARSNSRGSDPGTIDLGLGHLDPTAKLAAILRAAIAALPPPLGAASTVLDAGRATPTFTQPMRDALRAQYGGHCTFNHCCRPATIDHHIIHWSQGGRTSVANGGPVCDYHHYLVHEGGWRLRKNSDGTITAIPPPPNWPGPRTHWRDGKPKTGPPPDTSR